MIRLRGRILGTAQTQEAFRQARATLQTELSQALRASLFMVSRTAQRDYLSGPRPGRLGVVTNRLRGSLSEGNPELILQMEEQAAIVRGRVGTNVEYAPAHEFGAIIRPRRAKYLKIPLSAVKTPAGAVRSRYQGGRLPNTFVQRSRRGNLIIFQRVGKRLLALFLLVKQVTIPKRPFLNPALRDRTPDIQARFAQALRRMEQRANVLLRRRG